jgi:hypothetical protein
MEDFIFDDDVDEVGAEVEAFCPKCKADTTHVVISKYEDEIRRVQCNPCGDVHSYRKPKGEADDEAAPEPVKKKAAKAKPTYDQVMAKNKKPPRNYFPDEYFKEMEIVAHPKFGVGYVTENIGSDKIEVTFKDDKRVLVHNRKNLQLPVSMLKPLIPVEKAAKGKKARPQPAAPAQKGAARPAAKKPAKAPTAAAKPKAAKVKAKAPPKKVKRAARAAAPVRSKAKAKKAAPKKKAAGKKR